MKRIKKKCTRKIPYSYCTTVRGYMFISRRLKTACYTTEMESVFESELSNVLYGKAVASEDYDLPIDKRKGMLKFTRILCCIYV